jgi:hypothetical protein
MRVWTAELTRPSGCCSIDSIRLTALVGLKNSNATALHQRSIAELLLINTPYLNVAVLLLLTGTAQEQICVFDLSAICIRG